MMHTDCRRASSKIRNNVYLADKMPSNFVTDVIMLNPGMRCMLLYNVPLDQWFSNGGPQDGSGGAQIFGHFIKNRK